VPLIEEAEQLRADLEAEIKENERLARLERERVEREAATNPNPYLNPKALALTLALGGHQP
jgi:hypothetical protein